MADDDYTDNISFYIQQGKGGDMPRKRKTRAVAASRRAPAKVPDGNDGSELEEENRREKLELLLKDFNVECKLFLKY